MRKPDGERQSEQIEAEISEVNSLLHGLNWYLEEKKISNPLITGLTDTFIYGDLAKSRDLTGLDTLEVLNQMVQVLEHLKKAALDAGAPPEEITNENIKGYYKMFDAENAGSIGGGEAGLLADLLKDETKH